MHGNDNKNDEKNKLKILIELRNKLNYYQEKSFRNLKLINEKNKKNKGIVFWIEGFSGSGKSTISKLIAKSLNKKFGKTILLVVIN